jgi:hypothetical protein
MHDPFKYVNLQDESEKMVSRASVVLKNFVYRKFLKWQILWLILFHDFM